MFYGAKISRTREASRMLCGWLFLCPTNFSLSLLRKCVLMNRQTEVCRTFMKPTVLKFGGTSVEDANAFRNVAVIVESVADDRPLIRVASIRVFTDALVERV